MKNSSPVSKIHFIGIGGIGTSALAQYYLTQGYKVSGSDLTSSEITENLKNLGAEISIGPHKPRCLTSDVKQVIYSPAVGKDNPELKKAKELGIRIQNYPQALGELTKRYFTIAISGTHGKSTTTAMIGLILIKAGFDPTVIVGTKLKEFGNSNCRVGKSQYLVIEADEHFASFLNYWPRIIVLTNVEKEHLDYYKNLNNILKTYKKYISLLPKNGILITNKDDKNIIKITKQRFVNKTSFSTAVKKDVRYYSLKQKEAEKLRKILKIPGEHNSSNALAALIVARALKIPDKISFKALSEYRGAWRRFEIKHTKLHQSEHKSTQITIVSDYAHHPTEIKATLKAAREKFGNRKIWVIFQPHQYQRTYYLFDDFVSAFDSADEIILTEIFEVAGRETSKIQRKISSFDLATAIKKKGKRVYFIKDWRRITQFLKLKIKPSDIVLIMGAGDIHRLAETLVFKQ